MTGKAPAWWGLQAKDGEILVVTRPRELVRKFERIAQDAKVVRVDVRVRREKRRR